MSELAAAPPVAAPPLPVAALALVPLAGLGALASFGNAPQDLASLVSLPVIAVVTAAMTAPALIAASHTLHVDLPADRVVGALGAGIARAGRVAAGLLPLMVFELLTSELSTLVWIVGAGLAGLAGVSTARRGLVPGSEPSAHARLLSWGWAGLAGLVGLRLLASAVYDVGAA
jgi:hypothetical protein